MPEIEKKFTHKELTEMLIRHADVHEGLWGLIVEFTFGAASIPIAGPDNDFSPKPSGIVSVSRIGIRKFDEAGPLTVDAAKVNPAVTATEQRIRTKKAQSV